MAAAFPTADRSTRREIGQLLLARRHAPAIATLIVHFEFLHPALRAEVTSKVASLGAALSAAGRVRRSHGPGHVVDLIASTRTYRLASLVTEQLLHGPPDVRPDAARSLLTFAQQLNETNVTPTADRQAVESAIEEALDQFARHRQEPVLVAAALLLPRYRCKALRRSAEEPHAATTALVELLSRPRQGERGWLLPLTTVPALAPAAVAAMGAVIKAGRACEVLAAGHFLALGPTRRAVSRLANADACLPGDPPATIDATAARHLPTWIAALSLPEARRGQALTAFTGHPDALARLAALRRLMSVHDRATATSAASGMISPDPTSADRLLTAVAAFATDANADIARLALRHLLTTKWPGLSRLLLRLLSQSPHEEVRRLAAQRLGPGMFRWLWTAWPRLPRTKRIAAGKAVMKLHDGFHDDITRWLARPTHTLRLRALDIIAQLNQGASFEAQLIPLARGDDAKVAASAIKALASAASAEAIAALQASLAHGDSRVRANAIEALGLHADAQAIVPKLQAMADTDDSRPRANAIAHLIRRRDDRAPEQMRSMLADPRDPHRVSALWLVEHTGQLAAAAGVAELAVSDPSDRVRRKAGRTVAQLIRMMQRPLKMNLKNKSNPPPSLNASTAAATRTATATPLA